MSLPKRELDAEEAAARLGVRRETLYAYVSRGLVHRSRHPDGRRSVFDADEIEALRARSRRGAHGEMGIIVSTGVSQVSETSLLLAGRPLEACLDAGLVSTLATLWGEDPFPLVRDHELEARLRQMSDVLGPSATRMDRLRVGLDLARACDPLRHDEGAVLRPRVLSALLAALSGSLAKRPRHPVSALWSGLRSRGPTRAQREALEAMWVALLDHGLATSTLAVRVAASARCDLYSCVGCGLGALGGALHGAASAEVHRLLARASANGPERALGELLDRGASPGVGHAVYRERDPREVLLWPRLEAGWGQRRAWGVVSRVRTLLHAEGRRLVNVDFSLGALTFLAGMSPDAGEAIFAIARAGGWCAHVAEERREAPLRFRVKARHLSVGER